MVPTVPLAPGPFVTASPSSGVQSRTGRNNQQGHNEGDRHRSRSRLRTNNASIKDILDAQEALNDSDTSSRDQNDARLRKQIDSLQTTLECMRLDHTAVLKKASDQYDTLLSQTRTQQDRYARQMMQLCKVLVLAMGDDAVKPQLIKDAFDEAVPKYTQKASTSSASSVAATPITMHSSESEARDGHRSGQ